ncbi:MAG: secondary thiamine-phosphate synthase enzyme YjbQ [Thermodesulfobacteriota bacterium]|nr:secondary thiamine-phosphate synthase enzyme YjbQ [Thermodesulfobacteriota bacterium]
MDVFTVKTNQRIEMLDITSNVRKAIADSNVRDGICCVFMPHTTAAVTINENADPDVPRDILMELKKIVPLDDGYRHTEGNSDAHIKATLVGASVFIIVEEGRPALGTWQSVFFCEFDGPRSRKVWVKVMKP